MCSLRIAYLLRILSLLQLVFAQNLDLARSGLYLIRNCNAGQTGSKAEYLQNLLPQIYANLQRVIADTELGDHSTHGFEAFFHSNDSIPFVKGVYQDIATGSFIKTAMNTGGRALNPLFDYKFPTFVCIQDGDPQTAGMRSGCDKNFNVPAGVQDNFIILCPLFWEYEPAAESFSCPRVRRNTMTPNDDSLALNQQALLVHELSHIYGVRPDGRWQDGVMESYKIRDAFDLDEEAALKNAPNFAYYYAANQANCQKWPNRALPHDNLRGLLEVSADSPLVDDPVVPAANATGPLGFNISSTATLDPSFNSTTGFCNDAVAAPNASVCCNTATGYWIRGRMLRDGAGGNVSCAGAG